VTKERWSVQVQGGNTRSPECEPIETLAEVRRNVSLRRLARDESLLGEISCFTR
jgi:hypothetical protein